MNYYYLQPKALYVKYGLVALFIALFIIIVLGGYVYMLSNWNDIKCKNGNFYVAPLFFQDTDETMNFCLSSKIRSSIESKTENNQSAINTMKGNVSSLSNKIQSMDGTSQVLKTETESKLSSVTAILKQNVDYVKNALSTILGAIYISTNLNKGALTSYEDLQKSEIANIIDNYNNISA
jgi:hypothetical protein